MRHFFKDNLGLISARNSKSLIVNHFFCCDTLVEMKCGESTIQSYVFPLFVYPSQEKKDLFHAEGEARQPNIKADIFKSLSNVYKKEISPESIFYYIYAVLYSETYRTKYAEFLKIDFPRVPFTKDYKLFKKMAEYGNRLVDLHLLKSPELNLPVAKFQGKGENMVDKPRYDDKAGYVYINKTQYFEGISKNVWSYQIGGYQVCDKWLKDRKGRILSLDEIQTYCRIVTAIEKTIEIQKSGDDIYEKLERELI
jgi:predicted helicase